MRIAELSTYRTEAQPNLCILELRTESGLVGLGESVWAASAVEAYLHDVALPTLAALGDHAPLAVGAALRPYVGFSGSGAEIRGNGAVDVALWDVLGKSSGQPITRLLGGPVVDSMRVYNTCAGYDYVKEKSGQLTSNWGLPVSSDSARPYEDLQGFLERPAELVRSLLDEGYSAMKVWPFDAAAERTRGHDVSPQELRDGMAILEAIRGEAADAMDIMVEMHGLWSLRGASKILGALADIKPFWVEDPMRPDAVDGYRRLRERVDVPIAAGETLTGTRGFKPLFDAGVLDVAIVDVGWTGGISEAVKIASMADAYGVSFAAHDCTGPISFAVTTQVAASQVNGFIVENVRAYQASWYPQIVEGLPIVRDGRVEPSRAPGLGISLRGAFISRPDTRVRTTSLA